MPKLLYSATAADGQRLEGYVDADSLAAAREQLLGRGLRDVVLHEDLSIARSNAAELRGLSEKHLQALARLRLKVMQAPGLRPLIAEVVRRHWFWMLVDAALIGYGWYSGSFWWVAAGGIGLALPFALTVWGFRHTDRYLRMIEAYSVGRWDEASALIEQLRSVSADKPVMAFDLDIRVGCLLARQGQLEQALRTLEPWRARLVEQHGMFENRIASVYHAAGDEAGFVRLMEEALAAAPAEPSRQLDTALAHARFGDVERATALLGALDASLLPPHGDGFVHWAHGLCQRRRGEAQAVQTLSQAVGAFLAWHQQPAVWTALAMATADHALALAAAARHQEARRGLDHVSSIVRAHAQKPMLRQLHAAGLLPLHDS